MNPTKSTQLESGLTVVILTFNEESNIADCLDSVLGVASRIFVVDSYSSDRTVEIVRGYEDRDVSIVQHAFEGYSSQWNWALRSLPIRTEWTMKLDADERLTPNLAEEIRRELSEMRPEVAGLYVRFFLVFLGSTLRWGGLGSNYLLRLWRTGSGSFEDREVNEHAKVDGGTKSLAGYIEHRDAKSLADWVDRHNRYSSMEARLIVEGNVTGDIEPRLFGDPAQRRMWLKRSYQKLPCKFVAAGCYFIYRYLLRLGFLDGIAGFQYWYLHANHIYLIDLKVREYIRSGNAPRVVWPSRGEADALTAESDLQAKVDSGNDAQAPDPEDVLGAH